MDKNAENINNVIIAVEPDKSDPSKCDIRDDTAILDRDNVVCTQPRNNFKSNTNLKESCLPNVAGEQQAELMSEHDDCSEHSAPAMNRTQSLQETLCHGPVTLLAICTTFCCNLVLGIPAFVLAVLAQSASEHSMSRLYSRISLTLSLLGVMTGVIFYVTIVIVIVTS